MKTTASSPTFPISETEQSIVQRFERMVLKNPHALAELDGDVELSYSQLNYFADRIAVGLNILTSSNKFPRDIISAPRKL